ncbi:hypothetical protein FHX74_001427 [Friedmanniella endophytica]|uniref:Uncharacterized protein n=1 Tax=Microlunatus kandeliicorticis TaxID=1759536 RepID=A0A7W3IRC9_9ACTN|nr:hypothetical protein [Microlunatus kandeliicorticis]MBA8793822.1 hypothetical protein [Microlunatus kandeliicorticis]
MDITQLLITAGAVVGIVVVALLAIVPTVMEIPAPASPTGTRPGSTGPNPGPLPSRTAGTTRASRRHRSAPDAGASQDDDFHLAA